MAKSAITESHSLKFTGVLNLEDMEMEFEEIGKKSLKELLSKFDEENVTISISLRNDVIE